MENINRNGQVTKASPGYVVKFVLVTTIFILGLFATISPSPTFGTRSSTVSIAQPPELFTWINGYNLVFVPSNYRTWIILRCFENNQWPQYEITNLLPLNIDIDGVELARDLYGERTLSLLGVLKNGTAYFHPGMGTSFERSTNYTLKDVGTPGIVYVGESRPRLSDGKSCWAVAVRYVNDKKMVVRPLLIKTGHQFDGFKTPEVKLDDQAYGDPGIAYHNGKLVVAWLHQEPGHSTFLTYTATVVHNTTTDGFDLIPSGPSGIGELPGSPSGTKIDEKARPALTHDGRGLFYAAVLKYRGTAFVCVYSSADGVNWNWTDLGCDIPRNDFKAGLSQVSIAALPNGEILLAVTTTDQGNQAEKVYQRLSDGSWTELNTAFVFGVTSHPRTSAPFSLIRSQYRGPQREIYRDRGPVTYP